MRGRYNFVHRVEQGLARLKAAGNSEPQSIVIVFIRLNTINDSQKKKKKKKMYIVRG